MVSASALKGPMPTPRFLYFKIFWSSLSHFLPLGGFCPLLNLNLPKAKFLRLSSHSYSLRPVLGIPKEGVIIFYKTKMMTVIKSHLVTWRNTVLLQPSEETNQPRGAHVIKVFQKHHKPWSEQCYVILVRLFQFHKGTWNIQGAKSCGIASTIWLFLGGKLDFQLS